MGLGLEQLGVSGKREERGKKKKEKENKNNDNNNKLFIKINYLLILKNKIIYKIKIKQNNK